MSMLGARRLTSVVLTASLAVAGLSACRAQPDVAVYFGDTRQITEAQVQDVWDNAHKLLERQAGQEAQGAAAGPSATPGPVRMPITRTDIVRVLLLRDVAHRVAAQQGVTAPADVDPASIASSAHLPADSDYVRLSAEVSALLNALNEKAANAPKPSEDVLHDAYDALVAGGATQAKSFDEFTKGLSPDDTALLGQAAQLRNEIKAVTDPLNIKVNPRYPEFNLGLVSFRNSAGEPSPLVKAVLGGGDAIAPVTDVS
jgi:hypothetical protein